MRNYIVECDLLLDDKKLLLNSTVVLTGGEPARFRQSVTMGGTNKPQLYSSDGAPLKININASGISSFWTPV